MCRLLELNGECNRHNCQFAHSKDELRVHPNTLKRNYKKAKCKNFRPGQDGSCPYGIRCIFIHEEKKKVMTYKRKLDIWASQHRDILYNPGTDE